MIHIDSWPVARRASACCIAALAFAIALVPAPVAGAIPVAQDQLAAANSSQAGRSATLVAERNFPLLHVLASSPAFQRALRNNPAVQRVALARGARIEFAITNCKTDSACLLTAWLWTSEEIATVGAALAQDRQFAALAREHIRPSRAFARFETLGDRALVDAAWRTTAEGFNQIIRTYGLGEPPRYPAIDSISFAKEDPVFAGLIADALALIRTDEGAQIGSVFASQRFALDLLYLNERENAGFLPYLDTRENAPALAAIPGMDWTAYPYTLILVLGDGPDDTGRELGSYGKLRIKHAAALFREGKAPFLVVSGGNVHPARTRFNEAIEMKRELMMRYGIPEASIIVEPHARHTTTNFRNTARLMIRYGIPLDRDALVTTSTGHSQYAGGPMIRDKAQAELGYQPMRILRRLSPFDLVFRAEPMSTHVDPGDPLDP